MIQLAEQYKASSGEALTPQDLFLGALYERTGVLGELFLKGQFDIRSMQQTVSSWHEGGGQHASPFCTSLVSESVVQVMEDAERRAKADHQVYLSESHLCDALLELREVEDLLQFSASKMTKMDVHQIVCEGRDLAVHLDTFAMEQPASTDTVEIRRATPDDRAKVLLFTQQEFGVEWVAAAAFAFAHDPIPVFVATDNDELLGFACYDVLRGKQGLFGPMGTARACRRRGVGKALLYRTLDEMRTLGYDYAVISKAGPTEFYERACHAVLIPSIRRPFTSLFQSEPQSR